MWDPWAAGGQPAPPGASPQAAGELVLRAWSTSCPPAALTLGAAGLVLTPLSQLLSHSSFFPFLQSAFPEAHPVSLPGSALASGRSLLEPSGAGSDLTWGSFWALLPEATPAAPPQPNPSHVNPIQWEKKRLVLCELSS